MQAREKICSKLRNRAVALGHSGHARRYDVDPEYRLNMQAGGYTRDLYFDDGEAVGCIYIRWCVAGIRKNPSLYQN